MNATEATAEVGALQRRILWRWVIRVVVVVIMGVLVWLVLWSYFGRFLPAHRQFVEKTAQQINLANDVQQLMMKWDELDASQTDKRFDQAKASLFGGTNECNVWLEVLRTASAAMALNLDPRLGKADTNTLQRLGLVLVPAEIQIEPTAAPGFTNGPYHRLLSLTRSLELSAKRTDLLELTATGHSNSVEQARAVFQLWSQSASSK